MSKHKMDIFLRDVLQKIPEKFIYLLTGRKGRRILDNTFPSVKERKADLLVELDDGAIFHLELQTYPDKKMPLRMLEYRVLLMQKYPRKEIRQMVLYVGEGTPKMDSFINEQDLFYRYELKDIKELNCEELMNSSRLEDKILAVLCNVENPEHYFEQLIQELLGLPEKERTDYIRKLLTAVYYRPKLKVVLKRILEDRRMPLTITEEMIRQDPFYQEGLERGKLEAKKEDAKRLYVELKLPAEQIARILNIPLDVVREVIKEVK